MEIWDSPSAQEMQSLRSLNYNKTDGFVICFAINNFKSFEHACREWRIELEALGPDKECPIIFVGLKKDFRGTVYENVSVDEAMKAVKKYGFAEYVEVTIENEGEAEAPFVAIV